LLNQQIILCAHFTLTRKILGFTGKMSKLQELQNTHYWRKRRAESKLQIKILLFRLYKKLSSWPKKTIELHYGEEIFFLEFKSSSGHTWKFICKLRADKFFQSKFYYFIVGRNGRLGLRRQFTYITGRKILI
jgi:hypothetical protein